MGLTTFILTMSILGLTGLLIVTRQRLSRLAVVLDLQQIKWQEYDRDYRERYIAPEDAFLFHVRRNATQSTEDLEIVNWAKEKKIRFDYNYSFEQYDSEECISGELVLWIEKPQLAMEYKLRWHNT